MDRFYCEMASGKTEHIIVNFNFIEMVIQFGAVFTFQLPIYGRYRGLPLSVIVVGYVFTRCIYIGTLHSVRSCHC